MSNAPVARSWLSLFPSVETKCSGLVIAQRDTVMGGSCGSGFPDRSVPVTRSRSDVTSQRITVSAPPVVIGKFSPFCPVGTGSHYLETRAFAQAP